MGAPGLMDLTMGEQVEIVGEKKPGWMTVRKGGKEGTVPAAHLGKTRFIVNLIV